MLYLNICNFQVEIGAIVAAKFESDAKWYRCKVVSVTRDDYDENQTYVDLDYVDFGDYSQQKIEEVFHLDMQFLKLSFQAIECALADVKPK